MNIIKNSIHDFSAEFNNFSDTLEGCNYIVSFDAAFFRYEKNDIFTMEDLRIIYPDDHETRNVEGIMSLANYQEAKQKVRYGLRFVSENSLYILDNDEPLLKERQRTYWAIIHKYFPHKPVTVFTHAPCINSYFGRYAMWYFVYIFLRAGEGVVLAGQAWD